MNIKSMLLPLTIALLYCAHPTSLYANPFGGIVTQGSATLQYVLDTLIITASDGTIIEWQSFSNTSPELIDIQLPSSSAKVLLRVTGPSPTKIGGQLTSNGKVYLINNNGIQLTSTGQLTSDSLFTSTYSYSDASFNTNQDLSLSGLSTRPIYNAGTINCTNEVYTTSIKFTNDGFISASNIHHYATGTSLYSISLINDGTIQALTSPKTIFMEAINGYALQSDTLTAPGGTITFTGDMVSLGENSITDVSGAINGGILNIGGGWQGIDPSIPNAKSTSVDSTATLMANGASGNGGTIVVWADQFNDFLGTITAQGAIVGGTAEVSGLVFLNYQGTALVQTLVLDPANIVVQNTPPSPNIDGTPGNDISTPTQLANPATYGSITSYITATALNGLLTGGTHVILSAQNTITVNDAITAAGGFTGTLSLNAPAVNLNEPIQVNGGILNGTGANVVNIGPNGVIQNGVEVVSSGGTINLAAATYNQQVIIESKNLTLNGNGVGNTTLICNLSLASPYSGFYPMIVVHNSSAVNIQNMTIDGNYHGFGPPFNNDRLVGIYYFNAGGTADNLHITKIANSPPPYGGGQQGFGIVGNSPVGSNQLNISNTTVDFFQKGGFFLTGAGLTVNATNNNIIGLGVNSTPAANGIQVSGGATGTLADNTVTGIKFNGGSSTAFLLFSAGSNLTLIGNTANDSDLGIISISSGDGMLIQGNTASGNGDTGIFMIDNTGLTTLNSNFTSNNVNAGMYLFSSTQQPFNVTDNTFNAAGTANSLIIQGSTLNNAPESTLSGNVFTCP